MGCGYLHMHFKLINVLSWLTSNFLPGHFEVRVAEYLHSYPEPEPSGVNKFLKGLGRCCSVLSSVSKIHLRLLMSFLRFRKQDEAPTNEVKKDQRPIF